MELNSQQVLGLGTTAYLSRRNAIKDVDSLCILHRQKVETLRLHVRSWLLLTVGSFSTLNSIQDWPANNLFDDPCKSQI